MNKHLLFALCFICIVFAGLPADRLSAAGLVSEAAIAKQKNLTVYMKLSNDIPVIYRQVPGSDILEMHVVFTRGLKDIPHGRKSLTRWMWDLMPMSAKGYSKEKIFELTEKYALEISCLGGIEVSYCTLGTLNDHWKEVVPMFSAVIQSPKFDEKDAALVKERVVAGLKQAPSEPADYINDVVNRIYYTKDHPYRLTHEEVLAEIQKMQLDDVKKYHKEILNSANMRIVVVGSLDEKTALADLNRLFGGIKKKPRKPVAVTPPPYDPKNYLSFEDRDIPTAYIRAKFSAPNATHKDAVATTLMFEILSKELTTAVRTKKSLSYSVFSYSIQYSLGIGIIGVSTSKPEETLSTINQVIRDLKKSEYTITELDEFKNIFATEYYLNQETHSSMAYSIARSVHYHGSADFLYDFPTKIAQVTPGDVKRLANEILVDMCMGVIFNKKNFKEKWAKDFIEANQTKI